MERLWSPWRMQYVTIADGDEGCIFCDHLASGDDVDAHVLFRSEHCFVLLNAYPYNTGHLMVAPFRHVAELDALSPEERTDIMETTNSAISIIRRTMDAHGFNVGLNLGRAAGAGIPGHCHVHVVPRWGGDTNFMTTVGDTKVLPELIRDTDQKLRPHFAALSE
ncbi:MAG TPA: HIT domain-containing protein [Actinomycetota bacterium]|nr:HIT domain-containing protein [Actinomycetota bacterium]